MPKPNTQTAGAVTQTSPHSQVRCVCVSVAPASIRRSLNAAASHAEHLTFLWTRTPHFVIPTSCQPSIIQIFNILLRLSHTLFISDAQRSQATAVLVFSCGFRPFSTNTNFQSVTAGATGTTRALTHSNNPHYL